MENSYRILVGNPKGGDHLEEPDVVRRTLK
jgi:hypothetical protein